MYRTRLGKRVNEGRGTHLSLKHPQLPGSGWWPGLPEDSGMLKKGREAGRALDEAAGGSICSSVSLYVLARLLMVAVLTLLALPYALVLTDQRYRDAVTKSSEFPFRKPGFCLASPVMGRSLLGSGLEAGKWPAAFHGLDGVPHSCRNSSLNVEHTRPLMRKRRWL